MENYVKFNEFSWNREDLFACKNACRQIAEIYGTNAVEKLDAEGYFGNLNVSEIIEDKLYNLTYSFCDDEYYVQESDSEFRGRTSGTIYSSYTDDEGEWHSGGADWTEWGLSADEVRKYIPDFNGI